MKFLPRILASTFFGLALSASAFGSTVTINPDQDNTIFSESNNSAGASTSFFAGLNNAGGARRALLEFDLSSIPAGATITGVTLTLNVNQVGGGDLTARSTSLFRVTRAWGEGTSGAGMGGGGTGSAPTVGGSTWNYSTVSQTSPIAGTAWTAPGGDFTGSASATASVPAAVGLVSWSSAGLVSDVQGWLDAPATNFGWELIGDEVDLGAIRRFDSREASGAGTAAPSLTVTFAAVPEPAAGILFALGGIALFCWRGVRQNSPQRCR